MHIINNGAINKIRKGSIPLSVKNDKNFTFGMKSDIDLGSSDVDSRGSPPGKYQTQMAGIFAHSDNLKDTLQRKINMKMLLEE